MLASRGVDELIMRADILPLIYRLYFDIRAFKRRTSIDIREVDEIEVEMLRSATLHYYFACEIHSIRYRNAVILGFTPRNYRARHENIDARIKRHKRPGRKRLLSHYRMPQGKYQPLVDTPSPRVDMAGPFSVYRDNISR